MNEQDVKLAKVKTRCQRAIKIINVLKILVLIGAILSFVGACVLIGFRHEGDKAIAKAVANKEIDFDTEVEINGIFSSMIEMKELIDDGHYMLAISIVCFVAVVVCIVSYVLLKCFQRIFVDIRDGESPFSETVIKKLKKGFIIFAIAVLFFSDLGLALMVGLLLWCIYAIFEYGAVLQEQADETL